MSQLTLESALEIQELFFHSDAFPPVGGLLYSLNVIVNEVSSLCHVTYNSTNKISSKRFPVNLSMFC